MAISNVASVTPADADLLQSIASAAAEGKLDPEEAIKALEAEVAALEAVKPPEKPQRLTSALIAQRCVEATELARLSQDDIAQRVLGLTRLRLDRLRLDSMDGLDVCNGATHVMLQHNMLRQIEDLTFFNKLQYLVVSHNQLETLSGLTHLKSLQYLDATYNRIEMADPKALPTELMALELTGNPCADRRDYRTTLLEALPELLWLDDVRVSAKERGLEEDEEGEEGEEGEGDEESEGEDEEDEDEDEQREPAGAGSAGEVPSTFLSGAKAAIAAELAQVDSLLEHAGTPDLATQLPPPPPAAEVSSQPDIALDPAALYNKALEAYGVNKDVESTQAKVRAIHERVRARREELQRLEAARE